MMSPKASALVKVALCSLALAQSARATSFPVTLPDGLGSTITLARPPTRIVSLAPNVTEILFAIGAGDRVVGVTRYCNWPPQAKSRPKVGGYTDISIEAVIALAPDIVIASRGNPRRTLQALREHGLTVLAIGPQSIEQVQAAVALIGRATGNEAGARAVCARMEKAVADVRRAVGSVKRRRRVYFGSVTAPYIAAGTASFIGRCIALAGGDNIARQSDRPWPILSIEAIIERDPEVIVVGFHARARGEKGRKALLERLRRDRAWAHVSAVRTGRVYLMNDDMIHRPGPRLAEAVAQLAHLFYPERFPPDGKNKP